jgi:dUTPase
MKILGVEKEYPSNPGTLLVRRDPDQDFYPRFAKKGDVGIDLPVKININLIKFAKGKRTPGKLRAVMTHPDLKHYVYPNGTEEDPHPFLEVPSLGWAEIPAGISVKLPDDAWGLVKTRSCTAWKQHLIVSTSTIDPGYTGLLGTLVYNPNYFPVRVYEYDPKTGKGDKLSQLILIPVYPLQKIVIVDNLPETERGDTGFGSSGCMLRRSGE